MRGYTYLLFTSLTPLKINTVAMKKFKPMLSLKKIRPNSAPKTGNK
jgi:hypothetical protein